jgi:hypothetical protein
MGDGQTIADAAITSSDKTLTSASNPFVAADDVGKHVLVEGAGVGGLDLVTTIASWTSAGEVELTDAASTTVSGATARWATDNSAAFQAALNNIRTNGGLLEVPYGDYLIQTALTGNKRVILRGQGPSASIIRSYNEIDMLTLSGSTVSHSRIEGIEFTNHYDQTAVEGQGSFHGMGITFENCTDIVVRDCYFHDMGADAIGIDDCQRVRVQDCHFDTLHRCGVRMHEQTTGENKQIWVRDCYFTETAKNYDWGGSAAVQTHDSGTGKQTYVWVQDCFFEDCHRVSVGLDGCEHAWVERNRVIGDEVTGEGIAVAGAYITITENESSLNASSGVMAFGTTDYTNDHIYIRKNICYDNNGQGIAMVFGEQDVDFRDVYIEENRCYDTPTSPPTGPTQEFGIQSYQSAGVTNYSWTEPIVIRNNILTGNNSGPTSFLGGAELIYQNNIVSDGVEAMGQMRTYKPVDHLHSLFGTSGVESTEIGIIGRHRDESNTANQSKIRLLGGFNVNLDRKIGGLELERNAAFANRVDLYLLASRGGGSGDVVRVAQGIPVTSGAGGFGPTSSDWDDIHWIFGTWHLWISADNALRFKNGAPTSDDDGYSLAYLRELAVEDGCSRIPLPIPGRLPEC